MFLFSIGLNQMEGEFPLDVTKHRGQVFSEFPFGEVSSAFCLLLVLTLGLGPQNTKPLVAKTGVSSTGELRGLDWRI